MSTRKSTSCIGKAIGAPVTEYDSRDEAQAGADHARITYGRDLEPYQCSHCDLWHLAPGDRRTPSTTCPYCRGADGTPKESYVNEQDAMRRAAILREEQGIVLRAYPCPHGQGWHLTKN